MQNFVTNILSIQDFVLLFLPAQTQGYQIDDREEPRQTKAFSMMHCKRTVTTKSALEAGKESSETFHPECFGYKRN